LTSDKEFSGTTQWPSHWSAAGSAFRLAIEHLNGSGARSEEETMSTIALTSKASKLMKLCEIEGFETLDDLLQEVATDSAARQLLISP
jgi:hypothetical protein